MESGYTRLIISANLRHYRRKAIKRGILWVPFCIFQAHADLYQPAPRRVERVPKAIKKNVLTAVECQVSPPLQQLTIYITGTNLTNSPAIISWHISGCVIE